MDKKKKEESAVRVILLDGVFLYPTLRLGISKEDFLQDQIFPADACCVV